MSISSRLCPVTGMYSFTHLDYLHRLALLLLVLVFGFHQSLSCSVVQPCTSQPSIPKLSYEMGTSNPRMLCPRSDPNIKFWEFAICDGDSRPDCTLLPGQFCLLPDTSVAIADVCTSDNGAKLVFKNITKLSNSSGTKYVNFTSDFYIDTLQIQYSPTGVFVLEPIKQLSSDAKIALLTWYTYTPNQQINYTISHNGKVIANQLSNTVTGYGSVNLDNTVCEGSATGGEVTKEYTLLINNITATIGGDYVFKMDGIHEGVIILVPEFNDTTSSSAAPISVPSSSFITVPPSPVPPLSPLAPISTEIVTMSISPTIQQSSSPSVTSASSSIVSTTSSVIKVESTTPATSASPTASSGAVGNTVLLITILVMVLLVLVVAVVLTFVFIWHRYRKTNKVGETENGTTPIQKPSIRIRKISAFHRSNSQSVDEGTPVTTDPDPTIVRVLETSLQKNNTNLSSVSSNESTGSKRPLLLNEYRPEGSGSIVSSLSDTDGGRPATDLGSNNSASTLHPSSVQMDQFVAAVCNKLDNNTQKIMERFDKVDEVGAEIMESQRETQEMVVNGGITVEADVHENGDIMTSEVERQSSHEDTPPMTLRITDTPLMVQEGVPDAIEDNDSMADGRGSNDSITSHTHFEDDDDDTQDNNDGDM